MQKKLIALAVAGLMAAPAFAQSNVTIYGRFDIGFQSHSGDNGAVPSNRNGYTGLDTGLQGGNRIGFKGAEDLGNGLKAIFEMEFGSIANDIKDGGINGNRHSYVGLTGGFGTVVAGRLDGIRYGIYNKYDAFGAGNVGNFTQVTAQVDRADNAIAYISPSFGGFNLTLAYSTNVAGKEGTATAHGGNDGDGRLNSVMLAYGNGPIAANLDWERVYVQGSEEETRVSTVGGSYDFGMVKLAALYDILKHDDATGKQDADVRTWFLSAKAPITSNVILKATYGQTKNKEVNQSKTKKFGIGGDYLLSKRTSVYATYGNIRNDKNADIELNAAANSQGKGIGVRGFDLGFVHKF